jgi:predicted amidohydrolase YtcJ
LTNGRIDTLDRAQPLADTLVVRDGRIAFAGRRGEINVPLAEPAIDLGGRSVLPGLVDAHAHLVYLARARFTLNAAGVTSEEAVARMVAEAAARTGPGEWLGGRGWDQNLWRGRQFPTKASLDRAAPSQPVALVRVDGHATWCNSAALQAAEITRHTPNPEGGIVVKDEHGEPTGLLIDTAQHLVQRAEPRASEERFDRAVREASRISSPSSRWSVARPCFDARDPTRRAWCKLGYLSHPESVTHPNRRRRTTHGRSVIRIDPS